MDDRRSSERVTVNLKVEYKSEKGISEGFSTDLSKSGIFIESKNPPSHNSTLKLCFFLPFEMKKIEIRCSGTVERVVDPETASINFVIPGFGVRFQKFESDGSDHVSAFVDLKILQERTKGLSSSDSTLDSEKMIQEKQKEIIERILPHVQTVIIDDEFLKSFKKNSQYRKVERNHENERNFIDHEQTNDLSEENIKRQDEEANVFYVKSLKKFREGNYDQALELIGQATTLNPNKRTYHRTMKEIEENYKNIIISSMCQEVDNLLQEGEIEKSLERIDRCPVFVKETSQIINLKARVTFEMNDIDECLKLAKKAYSLNSKDPENLYLLGLIYKKIGDFDKAKAFLQKTIHLKDHKQAARELMKLLE